MTTLAIWAVIGAVFFCVVGTASIVVILWCLSHPVKDQFNYKHKE